MTIILCKTTHSNILKVSNDSFVHPVLLENEREFGAKLGWELFWQNEFVEEFIEGKTVTATCFSTSLGSLKDLPIVHVLYAYDSHEGETLLLEHNNTMYLGEDLNDSLTNPIQSEESDFRVDISPKVIFKEERSQSVTFPDDTIIPLMYDGVLPYIPIRRPTSNGIPSCRRLAMSSRFDWDPHAGKGSSFCLVNSELQPSNELSICH